jgi:membrane fusion protein (multidrug efflux system)
MYDRPARVRATLLTFTLAAAALTGCGRGQQGGPPAGMALPVTVVTLEAQPVTLVRELPGRTSAFLVAEVRPQVTGIVASRLFKEGTFVKAGEPLYQLDDATYRADYEVAKAGLARAEAAVEVARLRAKRTNELVKTGVVSQQDDDDAVATLRQAEADVEAARAARDSAAVRLGYARITSPIAGRVGKSAVTPGALVKAEQDAALATVQQLDPVYVDVTQSSAELIQLRRELAAGALEAPTSTSVGIVLEDGTRYAHDGTLEFSDVSVDPTTGSYLLRIKVPNPDQVLLPGMYVQALVGNAVRPQGLLLPQQALMRDPQGNATVFVVGKDGKAQVRPVKATRTIGDKWLVDDGLAAGDRVIVEGLQKVRPGAPVQATEAGSTPAGAAGSSQAAAGARSADGAPAAGTQH